MRQNADWWDTEQDHMRYYISRVKSKAYDQLQGYVREDGNLLFKNTDEIISILRSSFGDLDAAKTAAKTLFELKQENQPMAIFLPKFINLANKVDWTDSAKILALEKGLHRDIKHRLTFKSRSNIPTSYNAFVEMIKDIDYQLHENNTNYYKNGSNNNGTGCGRGNNNNGIGGGNTIPLVTPVVTHTSPVTAAKPTDLSAALVWKGSQGGRLCPKTPAKKLAKHEYCIASNLCLYCKLPSHKILECPILPTRCLTPALNASITGNTVTSAAGLE
ncbi:retrotransposon nucleocapsid protein [Lasallia pustulata]|uniref:Retrotransposon nucleocapsid protein n=1 Tax=Lasallia pustulata TaxID=136370 RepID=A0A1W5D374_9LECA|nr:retrotransposon nucleocapsid protein [Lasallia pustulata]